MVMVAGFETIGVDSLTPHIGAQINGVDLAEPLGNEQFSEIYRAWLDWKVIVFSRPAYRPGSAQSIRPTLRQSAHASDAARLRW